MIKKFQKKNKENSKKEKSIALAQTLILLIAIFAFCWMLNSEFKFVSSSDEEATCKSKGGTCFFPNDKNLIGASTTNEGQLDCPKGENCYVFSKAEEKKLGGDNSESEDDSGINLGEVISYTPPILDIVKKDKVKQATGDVGAKTGAETSKTSSGNYDKIDKFFLGKDGELNGFGEVASSFVHSVLYCGIVAAGAWALLKYVFKASDRNMGYMMDFIWIGLGAGVALGTVLGSLEGISSSAGGLYGALLTLTIIIVSFFAGYQTYAQEVYSYSASSWNPASGGKNCEKCNKLEYGCSEYQCRSFGKACNITNVGTTEEKCTWMNPNDKTGPEITPMNSVLELGYAYKPINTIAPPDKGVKITYTGEGKDNDLCIPPFTDLTLGVNTNEIAECKIDIVKKANMSDMVSQMVEGSLMTYNHTLIIPSSINPSNDALNNLGINLSANKDYSFYILCEDVNGNPSPYSFLMQFCVQSGPDTIAPIIKGTNYLNAINYISYNTQSAYLQVYTNEPADCKWDFQNLGYDDMTYNIPRCSQNISDFLIPSMLKYGCETNLTGIKNYEDNYYYIKCRDQPWLKGTQDESKRNTNKKSYTLILAGTSDLVIYDVSVNSKPNNTIIKDSTNQTKVTIGVKASGGAEEGKVKCQYKFGNNYLNFYNEGSQNYLIENTQSLWLENGIYNYPIKCFDIAGNTALSSVGFTIEKDLSSPVIVRAYSEEGKIKLITNEEATCVYSIASCNYNFEDGVEMETTDNLNHYTDWTTETDLFVKCKDMFGNRPLQDKCSIIVRGSDF